MGKRKAKKRSNSTLKTTSYFKRFQVKFARRRAGAYRIPGSRDTRVFGERSLGGGRALARSSSITRHVSGIELSSTQ
ncbi:hypothetical protein N9L76_09160 [bacterium]|nr:hypothetical protein [bacterium]